MTRKGVLLLRIFFFFFKDKVENERIISERSRQRKNARELPHRESAYRITTDDGLARWRCFNGFGLRALYQRPMFDVDDIVVSLICIRVCILINFNSFHALQDSILHFTYTYIHTYNHIRYLTGDLGFC